jgi:hypothetical protein
MGHCSSSGSVLWATADDRVLCYGPLRCIWFCAMGHCGASGSVLWATAAHMVLCYGPLWRIWFCAMGNCGASGSVLLATAAYLVLCYAPMQPIWFCVLGHCSTSASVLWATASRRYRKFTNKGNNVDMTRLESGMSFLQARASVTMGETLHQVRTAICVNRMRLELVAKANNMYSLLAISGWASFLTLCLSLFEGECFLAELPSFL